MAVKIYSMSIVSWQATRDAVRCDIHSPVGPHKMVTHKELKNVTIHCHQMLCTWRIYPSKHVKWCEQFMYFRLSPKHGHFKGLRVFTRVERVWKFTPAVDDWKSHQTRNCWTKCAIYKQNNADWTFRTRASEPKVKREPMRLDSAGMGSRRIRVMVVPHNLCSKEELG
jgi:hypothetical protein